MEEILEQIHQYSSGSAVIIGETARYLNGYSTSSNRTWVDISIASENNSLLDGLGSKIEVPNQTFPSPILHQSIIKTSNGYTLNILTQDEIPEHNIISGSNVITPLADLNLHINISSSSPSPFIHQRILDIKELYNL